MVRKAVDVQEVVADQAGSVAPWSRGNNCPLVEKIDISDVVMQSTGGIQDDSIAVDYGNMRKKERSELLERLRLVSPRKKAGYQSVINDQQRERLHAELMIRGFTGGEDEINLLLKGGSLTSGASLRIFWQNGRLREDDKWQQWI